MAWLLNLVLVLRSVATGRAPGANRKWTKECLAALVRVAGGSTPDIRPCYAGQGFFARCEKDG